MPKIKPASKADRKAIRDKLPTAEDKKAFKELGGLIDAKEDSLDWQYKVGCLVRRLCSGDSAPLTREQLKAGLGPSPSLFQKAARFAELYEAKEIPGLEEQGFTWTLLYYSFAIPNKEDRHTLLATAIKEKWDIDKLRKKIKKHIGSNRRGAGGRKPKTITPPDPEDAIQEIKRLSKLWTRYQEGGWSKVMPSEWDRLMQDCPAERIETLKIRLKDAETAVKSLVKGCDEVRVNLASLLEKATRKAERSKK